MLFLACVFVFLTFVPEFSFTFFSCFGHKFFFSFTFAWSSNVISPLTRARPNTEDHKGRDCVSQDSKTQIELSIKEIRNVRVKGRRTQMLLPGNCTGNSICTVIVYPVNPTVILVTWRCNLRPVVVREEALVKDVLVQALALTTYGVRYRVQVYDSQGQWTPCKPFLRTTHTL